MQNDEEEAMIKKLQLRRKEAEGLATMPRCPGLECLKDEKNAGTILEGRACLKIEIRILGCRPRRLSSKA